MSPSPQPPVSMRPFESITPADVATWEASWEAEELVPMGREGQSPIQAATSFVAHINARAAREGGEYAQIVCGPDRLGRVLLHYCGDRVFVRHGYRDGHHVALAVVAGRVQAGVRLGKPCPGTP